MLLYDHENAFKVKTFTSQMCTQNRENLDWKTPHLAKRDSKNMILEMWFLFGLMQIPQ